MFMMVIHIHTMGPSSQSFLARLLNPENLLPIILINLTCYYLDQVKSLTHHLNQFDLIQIVAGSPAWAYLAKHVTVPTVLQVATLVKVERERKIKSRSGLRKLYQKYATEKINKLEKQGMKYVDETFVEK